MGFILPRPIRPARARFSLNSADGNGKNEELDLRIVAYDDFKHVGQHYVMDFIFLQMQNSSIHESARRTPKFAISNSFDHRPL